MQPCQLLSVLADAHVALRPFPWPPAPLPPIPPFPAPSSDQGDRLVWSRSPYAQRLEFTPPNKPDVAFPRSQFCGTRVEGVPWMPGMGGNINTGPTLVMDLDLWKYKAGAVDGYGRTLTQADCDRYYGLIFQRKQATACTHVGFYVENAAELNWSMPDAIRLIKRWQLEFGGFADIWWCTANVWKRRDMTWAELGPAIEPWIVALLAAKAIDTHCLGLQVDGFLSGTALFSCVIGLGDRLYGLVKYFALHWLREGNANWDDGTYRDYHVDNRQTFWMFMDGLRWTDAAGWQPTGRKYVNRSLGQCDVNAPIVDTDGQGGSQGWAHDVMTALRGEQRFCPWEYKGQNAFDNPDKVPEWAQNMTGWLILCALGDHARFMAGDMSQVCGGWGNGNQWGVPNNGGPV